MNILYFFPVLLWFGIALASIIDPRAFWWGIISKFYRYPETNEPSDFGYLVFRIANALVNIGLISWFIVTRS